MSPRLKSRLWVEALLRRCQGEGKFGAVVKTGADEAGAIYVIINRLDGSSELLGPPAGPSTNDDGDRWFRRVFENAVAEREINAHLSRQQKFDADFWVVEIETRSGLADLILALI